MNQKRLLEIIKDNKGLICSIIGKYTNYYEFDDLYQVSVIGIIKAYKNFNPNLNIKFSTYAYKYILSEVLNYINNSQTIKTSREYNKLYKKIIESKNILTQKLMKEPTTHELSLFLELDESIIGDVLKMKEKVKSLDATIDNDGKTLTLLDTLYLPSDNINSNKLVLNELLETLNEEELKLIDLRYFQDKTQTEIASYFNTNQVQISRNEARILKKLKKTACKVA